MYQTLRYNGKEKGVVVYKTVMVSVLLERAV